MSKVEQHAWASLIALVAVFYYFQMRMLDGWTIVETTPKGLFSLYVMVIVMSIVAEGVIAAVIANKKIGDIEKDERDLFIEARAARVEHVFLLVAINVLIFHMLADAAYANHIFPSIELTDISTLFFALFSTLFIGEVARRVATIFYYRTGFVV